MRHIDFTPFHRSTIGFDNLFRMLDSAASLDSEAGGYPPYDIERTGETSYRITMAVAGFRSEDVHVDVKETALSVRGEKKPAENGKSEYLHKGIAQRAFERRFQLADYVEVTGAELKDGLLHINLVRNLPERMKARRIEVKASNDQAPQIEAEAS
ncbi:MAG: Hsp20 family protein [Hyphomicrobiaceae bacterium]